MRLSIVDVDGVELPLDGTEGYDAGRDWTGLVAPQATIQVDAAVGRQGGTLRRVSVQERELDVPVWVAADSPVELRERLRKLAAAVNPTRGDARLRVTYDDGETSDLVGRASDMVARGAAGTPTHQQVTVVWVAADPFWRGNEVVRLYDVSAPDFFDPDDGFPLQLAGDNIVDTLVEHVDGDNGAWPVWTIQGPGVPKITHEGTGQRIAFEDGFALASGELLTIDTQPGVKSVDVDGDSKYSDLTLDSELFILQPGANALLIELDEGTEDSLVRLRYRPRRSSP